MQCSLLLLVLAMLAIGDHGAAWAHASVVNHDAGTEPAAYQQPRDAGTPFLCEPTESCGSSAVRAPSDSAAPAHSSSERTLPAPGAHATRLAVGSTGASPAQGPRLVGVVVLTL